MTLFRDIVDLVYPRICASCDHNKPIYGQIFCLDCLVGLPQTRYHLTQGNAFEQHFWGRVDIHAGAAMYFFIPGGRTQTLLHNIKYRRRSDIAEKVGILYGKQISRSARFEKIDVVVPVPLHWRKRKKRGFNQSEAFARGLALSMKTELDTTILKRVIHTETQTRKSREQRVENMKGAFVVRDPRAIASSHVLLVDDVLTTGATLEACANRLNQAEGVKISLLTIACGRI